jgi:hypothetical protein
VNSDELDFVWRVAGDTLAKHYEKQHAKREAALSPFASLLAALHWMRHYGTTRELAAEFETKQSTLHELLNHTIDTLFATLVPVCFPDWSLPHRAYRTQALAGVTLVVDATFLALPHHADADERKTYYHHKSPTKQALKWQLTVTTDGTPWDISDVVHGSKADIMLLRESGVLDRLRGATVVLGDKGYIGEEQVMTPKKKPRLAELKEEDKDENMVKHSARVVVENCFPVFKRWAILGGVYRDGFRKDSDRERATRIVKVIAALVKRRLAVHPLRADPTATVKR